MIGSYNVTGDVVSVSICIALSLLLFVNSKEQSLRRTYLHTIAFLIVTACVLNFLRLAFIDHVVKYKAYEFYIVYIMYTVCCLLLLLFYTLYALSLNVIFSAYYHAQLITVYSCFFIYSIMVILTPFTKLFITAYDNDFQTGPLYYALYFYALLNLIYIIAGNLRNKKNLSKKVYKSAFTVLVIPVVLMSLQIIFSAMGYHFTLSGTIYSIPLLLCTIQFHASSFDYLTGAAGRNAYEYRISGNIASSRRFHVYDIRIRNYQTIVNDCTETQFSLFLSKLFHYFEELHPKLETYQLSSNRIVLYCPNISYSEARDIIINLDEKLSTPWTIQGRTIAISYKIICSSFPELSSSFPELTATLRRGMEKCNINSFYFCIPEDVQQCRFSQSVLYVLDDIRKNEDLDDERILVYLQPIYNMATDSYLSAEALIRLKMPDGTIIYPDSFIPLAEEYDFVHILSRIVVNKSSKMIRKFIRNRIPINGISVNFSTSEFSIPTFVEDIVKIITENNISYDKIIMEITESSIMENFDYVSSKMNELKKLGIRFYLDDFGAGYSNFDRLISLPFDMIKFDKSLVWAAAHSNNKLTMLEDLSAMLKKQNLALLYEGIENEHHESIARQLHIDYLQGYKYSKPVPCLEAMNFFSEHKKES